MSAEWTSYSRYRPSCVEWLGDVPKHWEVTAVKAKFTIQLGKMLQNRPRKSSDVEVPYLKAQHVQWFSVRTADAPKMWANEKDRTQFGIRPGDLLVCEGGEGGRCGIATKEVAGYIIQNALHRVRSRDSKKSRSDFLLYALSTLADIGWLDSLTDKATIAHFTKEKFGALNVPIPPFSEQSAIVRFLDHADRRIQRYIRAKEKLIALLEEQKQAIIHQAVTGQIDVRSGQPYPAYKPSGVEWLGDVPKHWEKRALSHLATKFGSGVTPRGGATIYQADGVPFLRSQNIRFNGLHMKDVARIPVKLHRQLASSHVKPGDVLLNITGASIGRACPVPDSFIEGNVNQHVCIIRSRRSRLLPDFLAAYLSTHGMQYEIQIEQVGASREGLSQQSIRNFRVVAPPVDEQEHIVEYIDEAAELIKNSIFCTRRQIKLLREYRTRLIADVVTGKLDVRGAADALPEADPLVADEMDDHFDTYNKNDSDGREESVEVAG